MKKHILYKPTKEDEIGYFAPKTWGFWRSVIASFCIFTIVGHWLEIPYCMFMDYFFGIVADDYAVWTDPWYHPYWVYGFGSLAITFLIEPLKESIVKRRRTLAGALLETFITCVTIAAVLELVIGLMINQPDSTGKYPFWDNSGLPFNIFGQAWLVNDIVIGFVAVIYVWVLYPLVCEGFILLKSERKANFVLAIIVIVFLGCCTASYIQLNFFT